MAGNLVYVQYEAKAVPHDGSYCMACKEKIWAQTWRLVLIIRGKRFECSQEYSLCSRCADKMGDED